MNAYPARASFTTFPETFTNLTGGEARRRRGRGGDSWVLKKQLVTKGEKSENRPFSGRSKSLSITHCMHLQREKEECSPRTVCFLSTRDAMLSTYCKLA